MMNQEEEQKQPEEAKKGDRRKKGKRERWHDKKEKKVDDWDNSGNRAENSHKLVEEKHNEDFVKYYRKL